MKIMRDGFVFECESMDEARSVVNMFKFGKPAKIKVFSDEAKVGKTKRYVRKFSARRGSYKVWTEGEIGALMRMYRDGMDTQEICKASVLDRHSYGAIYNKIWCLKHGTERLGNKFVEIVKRLGYQI